MAAFAMLHFADVRPTYVVKSDKLETTQWPNTTVIVSRKRLHPMHKYEKL